MRLTLILESRPIRQTEGHQRIGILDSVIGARLAVCSDFVRDRTETEQLHINDNGWMRLDRQDWRRLVIHRLQPCKWLISYQAQKLHWW